MKSFIRKYFQSFGGAVGAGMFIVLSVSAVLAPSIAHQNPFDLAQLDIMSSRLPPGSVAADGYVFWFGTDDQGRDLVSAVLYGLRLSLFVAMVSTLIALVIGVIAGLSAAYVAGAYDAFLMRIVDLQLAFPSVLIALVLVALLGSGLEKVILAIVAAQWAYFARTVRSAAVVERGKEYIQAARTLRFSSLRIMFVHLLPNSVAPLSVIVLVETAGAITLEATLSFLGVGLSVTRPSLGLLVANGYSFMLSREYWLSFFPALVLALLLISVNLIGERLRQINNPRELTTI